MRRATTESGTAKLPPIARIGRVLGFTVTCLIIIGVGFIVGYFVRSPQLSALDADREPITVFAEAESRTVSTGLNEQGFVNAAQTLTIPGLRAEAGQKAVVTKTSVSSGVVVENRMMVATVSDRPLFALKLVVPPYRDIHVNDQGSDVASLQEALGVNQTQKVNWATLVAINKLYRENDVTAPKDGEGNVYLPIAEVLPIIVAEPTRVESVANVGTILDTETPLLKLRAGQVTVSFRVTVAKLALIKVDNPVKIRSGQGVIVEGLVSAVSGFLPASAGEGTAIPGYDVRVKFLQPPATGDYPPGQSVIITDIDIPPPSLAVPQLSIRQDGTGNYVLKKQDLKTGNKTPTTKPTTVRISIKVTAQNDGWVAVTADSLNAGDQVQVQP